MINGLLMGRVQSSVLSVTAPDAGAMADAAVDADSGRCRTPASTAARLMMRVFGTTLGPRQTEEWAKETQGATPGQTPRRLDRSNPMVTAAIVGLPRRRRDQRTRARGCSPLSHVSRASGCGAARKLNVHDVVPALGGAWRIRWPPSWSANAAKQDMYSTIHHDIAVSSMRDVARSSYLIAGARR